MSDCEHDYENPRRVSRAAYLCPKCGDDISLPVMLISVAGEEHKQQTLDRMQKWQENLLPVLKSMQDKLLDGKNKMARYAYQRQLWGMPPPKKFQRQTTRWQLYLGMTVPIHPSLRTKSGRRDRFKLFRQARKDNAFPQKGWEFPANCHPNPTSEPVPQPSCCSTSEAGSDPCAPPPAPLRPETSMTCDASGVKMA